MKKFIKRVLSLLLSCCCVFSITACEGKECSHSYTSEVTKEATCGETGIRTYTCDICGDSYMEDIAKLTTHSYTSAITKEATCGETGIRTYTCGICGDSYMEDIAKLTTHSYTSEVTKEATCQVGIRTYTCSICDDSYTEDVAPNIFSHSGSSVCKICGINYHKVITDYIKTYGTYSSKNAQLKFNIDLYGKTYLLDLEVVLDSGNLSFYLSEDSVVKGIVLVIPPTLSNLTYYYIELNGNISDSMSGSIVSSAIKNSTTTLPYTNFSSRQNVHTSTYIQNQACNYLKLMLDALNIFMVEKNLGIGTKHLGFTNYPSNGD